MTDHRRVVALEPVRPPDQADEKETLVARLNFLRESVVNAVAGLTTEQALVVAVPPSPLTPAGIVRHLRCIERWWLAIDFAAFDVPEPWDDANEGGWRLDPDESLAAVVTGYLAECARSNEVIARYDLGSVARAADVAYDLRHVVVHLIEETARHLGQLDLLRQAINGSAA